MAARKPLQIVIVVVAVAVVGAHYDIGDHYPSAKRKDLWMCTVKNYHKMIA